MSKIAKEADVGIGTIYHYFKSKAHMINALFIYVNRLINAAITKDYDSNATVEEQYINISRKCQTFLQYKQYKLPHFVH